MPELFLLPAFLDGTWVGQGWITSLCIGLGLKCQDGELGHSPTGDGEPWRVCEQEQGMIDLGAVKGQSGLTQGEVA